MSWRNCLIPHIKHNGLTGIYQFGVYTGQSIVDIVNAYTIANIRYDNVYGFDSFTGLPEEKAEPISQDCWNKGEFDTTKLLGVDSVESAINITHNKISMAVNPSANIFFISGFFSDSLNDDLIKTKILKPAHYVDIDVDLYSSAKECLQFMFKNKLIQPGTLIGYDDWKGSRGWKTMSDGESRAHKEIVNEFGVKCTLLEEIGYTFPHGQMLFRVDAINGN